jgi:hypothetical protein
VIHAPGRSLPSGHPCSAGWQHLRHHQKQHRAPMCSCSQPRRPAKLETCFNAVGTFGFLSRSGAWPQMHTMWRRCRTSKSAQPDQIRLRSDSSSCLSGSDVFGVSPRFEECYIPCWHSNLSSPSSHRATLYQSTWLPPAAAIRNGTRNTSADGVQQHVQRSVCLALQISCPASSSSAMTNISILARTTWHVLTCKVLTEQIVYPVKYFVHEQVGEQAGTTLRL